MSFDNGHALLIGVGTYQNSPDHTVNNTAKDAQSIAKVLRDRKFCGYPDNQVQVLSDATATRDGILGGLKKLVQDVEQADATVLLFYSGHGVFGSDGEYYLTSSDTQFSGGKVVPGTGVGQQELLTLVKDLVAKKVLMIFNACHSGALSPQMLGEKPVPKMLGETLPGQTTAALLGTGEGRIIITACRKKQVSFVGDGELTIFGQQLADGLRGDEIATHSGYISAFDLYTRIYEGVGHVVDTTIDAGSRKLYGGTPEPELTVIQGIGPFPVALYRGATTLGSFSAPSKPAAVKAFNEITKAASQQALLQIIGDVVGGDKAGSNIAKDHARIIDTGGGKYVEGNSDERVGVFMSGGTVYGTVVGVQHNTGSAAPQAERSLSLAEALDQLQRAGAQLIGATAQDFADDVLRPLQVALDAEHGGDMARRASRLSAARERLDQLAKGSAALQPLTAILSRVR